MVSWLFSAGGGGSMMSPSSRMPMVPSSPDVSVGGSNSSADASWMLEICMKGRTNNPIMIKNIFNFLTRIISSINQFLNYLIHRQHRIPDISSIQQWFQPIIASSTINNLLTINKRSKTHQKRTRSCPMKVVLRCYETILLCIVLY